LTGGLKIWECTRDLAEFLICEHINLTGKLVLDLGCGTGLLGILAMYLGAHSVHFQDYVSKSSWGWIGTYIGDFSGHHDVISNKTRMNSA
jgi:predicted nicotinamide N-methyase